MVSEAQEALQYCSYPCCRHPDLALMRPHAHDTGLSIAMVARGKGEKTETG